MPMILRSRSQTCSPLFVHFSVSPNKLLNICIKALHHCFQDSILSRPVDVRPVDGLALVGGIRDPLVSFSSLPKVFRQIGMSKQCRPKQTLQNVAFNQGLCCNFVVKWTCSNFKTSMVRRKGV